jgi:F-box and WD-40 domain protein CDC4
LTFAASAGRVVTCLYLAGDRIVSGSDDATIVVWDARTGQCIRRLYGHEGGIWALEVFGDTIVTGSTDRSVRVWNQNTGRCTHLFWGHGSTVRSMKIMLPKLQPDGRRIPEQPIIITGGRDHTVRIWRLPNPNTDTPYLPPPTTVENGPFWMHTFTGHAGSVRAVDGWGRYVVSASYDHTIGVWDIMNGQRRHVLIGHTAKVYSVSVEEGGKRCASGGMDNTVRLWNLEDSSGLLILEGHTSLVGLLQLTPLQIISAAADSTLRIWDSASGEPITVMLGHMGAITCFHAKYGRLVSGSDGTLKLWDLPKGKNHRPANNERYVIGLGVIRDGFVRNLLDRVNGVWQIRFDRSRCVAVVQRESTTWFEIMDFSPFTHT